MEELNAANFEPFMDPWAEDAVWHATGRNRLAGHHVGREAIRRFFERGMEGDVVAEPLEMLADEEHFVFFVRLRAQHGGRTLDQVHANALRVRDGRFVEGFFLPDDQRAYDEFFT